MEKVFVIDFLCILRETVYFLLAIMITIIKFISQYRLKINFHKITKNNIQKTVTVMNYIFITILLQYLCTFKNIIFKVL